MQTSLPRLLYHKIKASERFVVTDAYTVEHIKACFEAISNAYSSYAPRYKGDEDYDVKTLIKRHT